MALAGCLNVIRDLICFSLFYFCGLWINVLFKDSLRSNSKCGRKGQVGIGCFLGDGRLEIDVGVGERGFWVSLAFLCAHMGERNVANKRTTGIDCGADDGLCCISLTSLLAYFGMSNVAVEGGAGVNAFGR